MTAVPAHAHQWLIRRRMFAYGQPSLRVVCALCAERQTWPASRERFAHGSWDDYQRRRKLERDNLAEEPRDPPAPL